MKTKTYSSKAQVLFYLLSFLFLNIHAQDKALTSKFKNSTIETIANLLADNYVFAKTGTKASKHIKELNETGYFDSSESLEKFALKLTSTIYAVTQDKHITVSLRNNNEASSDPVNDWIESRMGERNYFRHTNGNFKNVKRLHNNIGYLELRGFYSLDYGKYLADHAMAMLKTSDAIIIDLRSNGGGRGDGASYLVSHFFEEPVITSKSTKRQGKQFIEKIDYSPKIEDTRKMPDVPLFILTSSSTFSAAEGFAYILQAYKRATIIGEITKGGANAGDLIQVNKYLNIFIPDVAVSHPITNDTWEGVGIIPDIMVRNGDALEVAIEKAQEVALKHKIHNEEKSRNLLRELNDAVTNFNQDPSIQKILNLYLECKKQNLVFEEWEINRLGYNYFKKEDGKSTAEALFKVNTLLYPESANTFDSYAEVLVANDKIDEAIQSSEKAVALAEKNSDKNLELFKKNLRKYKNLKR